MATIIRITMTLNPRFLISSFLLLAGVLALPGLAHADCTTPDGVEGQMIYNTTAKMMQYCNGSSWVNMAGSAGYSSGGSLQLGDDADSCTAGKAGTQRYNSSTGKMEYCNGTAWTAMGGTFELKDTNLYMWGGNNTWSVLGNGLTGHAYSSPVTVTILNETVTFTDIAPGAWQAACGLDSDGKAWCWGSFGISNIYTAVAPKKISDSLTFTSIYGSPTGNGASHWCGITSSNAGYCWGSNTSGKLGDGTTTYSTTPVAIAGGYSWKSFGMGGQNQTCGVTTSGTGYCWGAGYNGFTPNSSQLSPTTPVAGGHTWEKLSPGSETVCGITTTGTAYCWGKNTTYYKFGNGTTTDSDTPTPVSGGHSFVDIQMSTVNACARKSNGQIWCWGGGNYGGNGDGDTDHESAPVQVSGGHTFVDFSTGAWSNTCAVVSDGTPYCWGLNDANGFMLLDGGATSSVLTPTAVSTTLKFSKIIINTGNVMGLKK